MDGNLGCSYKSVGANLLPANLLRSRRHCCNVCSYIAIHTGLLHIKGFHTELLHTETSH